MAKFQSLTHSGPIFPQAYEAKNYTFRKEILSPLAEEMLWSFAHLIDTEYFSNKKIQDNFYSCLKHELTKGQQTVVFPSGYLILLNDMARKQIVLKEEKKEYNRQNKKKLEKERLERKEKFGYAMLDGSRQPLGSYLIEGPGIYMTRGENPLKGLWKYRTEPEDVSINYVGNGKPPKAPSGHKWKEVVSNQDAFWTARYDIQIGHNGEHKTTKAIMFGASSSVKADADQHKFKKAQELLLHWDDMQKHIEDNLTSNDSKTKQCAVIAYLIQCSGIRIGHDRDLDTQADTCGASTLYAENIKVKKTGIELNFIGKDSIPYNNSIDIDNNNFLKAVAELQTPYRKSNGTYKHEHIFSVTADDVNAFLSEAVSCATAKLYRTAIGTKTLCDILRDSDIPENATIEEKLEIFTKANMAVAKRLNHQKAVPASWQSQIDRMNEQIELQKKRIESCTAECEKEKLASDKRIKTYSKVFSGDRLLVAMAREKAKAEKEAMKLENAKKRLASMVQKLALKEATKGMALNTSKTNYSSPRITWSFCKANNIPIDKIFSKVLQEKFAWAENTSPAYYKEYPNVD